MVAAWVLIGLGLFCFGGAFPLYVRANRRRTLPRWGTRTTGWCANLNWTTRGSVSCVIAYDDATNVRRATRSAPGKSIKYAVGTPVDVFYDPQARVEAVVAEERFSWVEYFVVFVAAAFGALFFLLGASAAF
ncbi:DUF3592 domain-containing protein [Streptomyces sp. TRM70308]|uniref:hypothetical protein n=1 Tax=Streptomyces sp. TRM70308 TaxID=3131932 RepID=UPI003D066042